MADFNTEQLLEMLQRQGGAGNLDLSGHDLTGINLSGEALEELDRKSTRLNSSH